MTARWYEFKVVVDGVPGADDVERLFALPTEPTVESAPRQGTAVVWCAGSGPTLADAVVDGVLEVEATGLRALRVEAQPWVTITDIAARVGRSPAAVRQWATGRWPATGFPAPLTPSDPTALRSWHQVSAWLRDVLGYELPDDTAVLAAASLALRLRAMAPQVPGMPALYRLLDR